MYTCNEFDCLIGLAVDGLLDGPDRAALEQHLTECAACRRKLADLTAIKAELARPVEAPADLHDRIMAGITAHEKQRRLRRMLKKFGSAAAVLVVCFVVAGGLSLMGSGLLGAKSAEDADCNMTAASTGSTGSTASSTAGGAGSSSVYSAEYAAQADAANSNSGTPATTVNEPSTAPQAPTPDPVPTKPASGATNSAETSKETLYRKLMEGDGIAFTGAYAFNLILKGDPEEIKKILGAEEAGETAEGYVILKVSADFNLVCDQLKLAGCSFVEDARNGMTSGGAAPEYGLVSVKIN